MVQSELIGYIPVPPRILNVYFIIIVGIIGASTLINNYESNLLDIDWEKLTETPF